MAIKGWMPVLAVVMAVAAVWFVKRSGPPEPSAAAPPEIPGARLLEGLGSHRHPITANAEAQRWFDQGLILSYGFNHDAAERSFLMGTAADPECAMCWWGAALVLGPHVNAGMDAANNPKAWERIGKAQALAARASPAEQAYIRALAARYAAEPPTDRRLLDQAWATAMADLVRQYPDDLDAATLLAESLMDLQPWDYYLPDGTAKGQTATIVATLESIMARNPDHPGALHLYIHAVEASRDPGRGAQAADRLRGLVPGAGHLVHMPAHIYARVGRYHDAMVANQKAIDADETYLAVCKPGPAGLYPLGYVPHNHHFLWFSATMAGASGVALKSAEETGKRADIPDLLKAPGYAALQHYWLTPLFAKVRFGRWDEIVATPRPDAAMPYAVAIWHYAQGMAALRQKRLEDAKAHMQALSAAAVDPEMDTLMVWDRYSLALGLRVGERSLAGELLAAEGKPREAEAALREAVRLDDALPYDEPPAWHMPARHTLGAVLLAAGKAREAEAVYREDLLRYQANGWSLHGLAQSLDAQGRSSDAREVRNQMQAAWAHADIDLPASRF